MRIGLLGLGTVFLIFFLIIVNTSEIPKEKIDQIFVGADGNFSDKNYSTDQNLSNFIKYTGQGIIKEVHGTYYFASWLNQFIPSWLSKNVELLAIIAILAIAAPVIAVILKYAILILLAIFLAIYEKMKENRRGKQA